MYVLASVPLRGLEWSLALAVLASGCGGGGALRGQVYEDSEATYRVGPLGPSWERIELAHNDLAWRDPATNAIVQVNATCDPFRDVPLTSLTNHLLIGFTDRERVSRRLVPLDGREALRSRYLASLDGVPRALLLYVLKKDECTYDFALVSPPGAPYREAEPIFERFVEAFSTEAR